MGLLQRTRTALASAIAGKPIQQTDDTLASAAISAPEAPDRDARGLLLSYMDSPWHNSVVGRVADAVAPTKWRVFEPTGDTGMRSMPGLARASFDSRIIEVEHLQESQQIKEWVGHPVVKMLEVGNKLLVGQSVIKLTQVYLEILGEAFWIIGRNSLGVPSTIWPVPPTDVLATPGGEDDFYHIQIGDSMLVLPESWVIRFHDPNPLDPYGRGTGRSAALTDELDIGEYSSKCHDIETECLTRRGWVHGMSLRDDDEVGTWNEGKQCLEYQRPDVIVQQRYTGKMHHWFGQSVDALVTPNHRMWIQKDLYSNAEVPLEPTWCFEESQKVLEKPGRVFRIRDAGRYDGGVDVVEIPGSPRVTKRKPNSRGGGRPPMRGVEEALTFNAAEFAPFLGFYVSEGSPSGAAAYIGQSANGYIEEIREALSIFPEEWVREKKSGPNRTSKQDTYKWSVHHHSLTQWLRAQTGEGAYNKRLPAIVFEWNLEAQERLLQALINGDGSRHKSGKSAQYCSMSEGLIGDIQRLCMQLGYSSVYRQDGRGLYVLTVKFGRCLRHICSEQTWASEEEYEGWIWCVGVPNGTVFTRRNGRALLSGNTLRSFFYNRARPDFLVTVEGAGETAIKQLEAKWLASTQGLFKRFLPFFLNRKAEVKEMSQTFESMQLSDLLKRERDVMQQTRHIPPELMGITDTANRSTISSAEYLFARWTIVPRLEFMRHTLQAQLMPMFSDGLVLTYDSPVMEDKEFQLRAATIMPWTLKINEWRVRQGAKPLPGDEGDKFIITNRVTVHEMPSAAEEQAKRESQK